MDKASRVAFVMAQVVCAQAEIESMKAANAERAGQGDGRYAVAYGEEAFARVPERYGITANQVIEYLREDA